MRLPGLLLLLTAVGWSAELQLNFALRWGNEVLALPQGGLRTATGQLVEITRLSALLSDFQLLQPDGSVVRLEGQYGYLDVASDRLSVALKNVPAGNYKGLQMVIGVPAALNHADPGIWPAGHPLNPQVNSMHWNWAGGYVFMALEGYWRDAGASDPSGFSYHLAGDERAMRVRFLTSFAVESATRVTLALDASKLFRDRQIAQDDGSDSTHSATGDELAAQLSTATKRAFFWLGTAPAQITESEHPSPSVAASGTPVAFTVPAGFPQPDLPADNPLTAEGIELGRRLFGDPRLSGNESQSCVTCHDPANAFSDRVALSRGADGTSGVRNAMPLFNLAWHPAYAWDGSKKTIRAQALAAMTNPIEMHANLGEVIAKLTGDPQVEEDFAQAFGSPEITGERIGLALEQFLLAEVSADSRFDRAMRGEAQLSAAEQQGFALFLTEYDPVRGKRGGDCFHCHGGGLFSDFVARSNGLDMRPVDAGLKNVTGLVYDNGRFKTPSLRNVALTAPYMHDGRFATLEQVVAHYDHGVQRSANLDPNLAKHPSKGMGLTNDEQSALVAFLRTLTDERYRTPNKVTLSD
ncbi:MAG: MbnP family protein [Opitutaceae bacterium]